MAARMLQQRARAPAAAAARPKRAASSRRCAAVAADAGALNEQFGIPGSVFFGEGEGGLPTVSLTHTSGAAATVYLFGADVTSWTMPGGHDMLYVRPDAVFNGVKPISGGIPHCFPQFGPGEMQQHGFARNLVWSVASTSADPNPDDPDPEVVLALEDSAETRAMWDFPFRAVYGITLRANQLTCQLRVLNTGDAPFEFTAALHSYFAAQIGAVKVEGLEGLTYLNKIPDGNNPTTETLAAGPLTVSGPVDSVFLGAPDELVLTTGHPYNLEIQNSGFADAVVWSPWEDMPEAYPNFVCVENAAVAAPVAVAPGEAFAGQVVLNAFKA